MKSRPELQSINKATTGGHHTESKGQGWRLVQGNRTRYKINSPNSKYTVQLQGKQNNLSLAIKENSTPKKDIIFDVPTLLLKLVWNSDPNSFVTIEHIAKGSYSRIFYLKNGQWEHFEFEGLPNVMSDSSVHKIKLMPNEVNIEFISTKIESNGYPIASGIYSLSVAIPQGMIRNQKWMPITQEENIKLLAKEPQIRSVPSK